MKKTLLIALVLALILALVAGSTVSAVTNGEPDNDGHPYVGSVVFDVYVPDVGNVPAWRCTGAMLTPYVFLTAGHCTDGASAARVWLEDDMKDVNDWPAGGGDSTEGTPYTYPGYCPGCGPGLPGFDSGDVGVVILDEPLYPDRFASLPAAGYVDTLEMRTEVTLVGYGVQWQILGGGPPAWAWNGERYTAPADLITSNHVHSAEFIKLTANPGQGKGGTCFGDSGGPDLIDDTVIAVNAYVTNGNCKGVTYSNRVDMPEVLAWVYGFLP